LTETREEAERRAQRELEGKNIEHYAVLLEAWIQNRMERDKTVVTLSAAGVGLLVTVLTTVGIRHSWMMALYGASFLGFFVSIVVALRLYSKNADLIENELRGSQSTTYRQINLKPYDRVSFLAFLVGALFAVAIGCVSALSNQRIAEEAMRKPSSTERTQPTLEKRSVDGIQNLRPKPPEPEPLPAPVPPTAIPQPTPGNKSPQ
jgi:hypothetical protein